MKLFLVVITVFFLCLLAGPESKSSVVTDRNYPVVVEGSVQVEQEDILCVDTPQWLKTYLFIQEVLNPVKQLDLPGDHQKSWNYLHGRILHFLHHGILAAQLQVCCSSKYIRLLGVRHGDGFYLYSLEKLLI